MSKFTEVPYIEKVLAELSGENKAKLLNFINGLGENGSGSTSYTLIKDFSEFEDLESGITPIEYKFSQTIAWKGYFIKSEHYQSFITFKNSIDLLSASVYAIGEINLVYKEEATSDYIRALLREDSYIDSEELAESESGSNLPDATEASVGDVLTLNSSKEASWATPAAPGMSNPMSAAGDIIVGGESGAASRLAKGSAGQILTMNSGATSPEWANPPAAGMANPMTAAGDIIYGGTSGTPTALAAGEHGKFLMLYNSTPTWQKIAAFRLHTVVFGAAYVTEDEVSVRYDATIKVLSPQTYAFSSGSCLWVSDGNIIITACTLNRIVNSTTTTLNAICTGMLQYMSSKNRNLAVFQILDSSRANVERTLVLKELNVSSDTVSDI